MMMVKSCTDGGSRTGVALLAPERYDGNMSPLSLATAPKQLTLNFDSNTPKHHDPPPTLTTTHTMSSPRALTALARSRPTYSLLIAATGRTSSFSLAFSTVARRQKPAVEGPPPANFRITPPPRYNEQKESVWDQAGKYFLLTEMARGMYVLLEQFFRPP